MIIEIQRRLREVGRIRLGEKKQTKGGKTYPAKLTSFRLTSKSEQAIAAAAKALGGTAQEWADSPDGSRQWELYTDTNRIAVIIPPGKTSFSQHLELWSAGGCSRRCDGEWDTISEGPCVCADEDGDRQCQPHTRLSLILRDIQTLGVWRLDTSGWNAAAELGGAVEVCQIALEQGRMVPAWLRLEEREQKKPGEAKRQFVVPVLDVTLDLRALGSVVSSAQPATIEQTSVVELAPDGQVADWQPIEPQALPAGPSISDQMATADEPGEPSKRANAAAPIVKPDIAPRTAAQRAEQTSDNEPPRAMPGKRPSDAQLRRLFALCANAGLDDDGRHDLTAYLTSGQTESSKDLDVDTYDVLCDVIEGLAADQIAIRYEANGKLSVVKRRNVDLPTGLKPRVVACQKRWREQAEGDAA